MAKTFKQAMKTVERIFNQNAVDYQDKFTVALGGEIATDTPQDTGKAKAHWDAGFSASITTNEDRDLTRTGSRARKKMRGQLKGGPKKAQGRTTYIKNGVKSDDPEDGGYILKLEQGGSAQAPFGMVTPILANLSRIKRMVKK